MFDCLSLSPQAGGYAASGQKPPGCPGCCETVKLFDHPVCDAARYLFLKLMHFNYMMF